MRVHSACAPDAANPPPIIAAYEGDPPAMRLDPYTNDAGGRFIYVDPATGTFDAMRPSAGNVGERRSDQINFRVLPAPAGHNRREYKSRPFVATLLIYGRGRRNQARGISSRAFVRLDRTKTG